MHTSRGNIPVLSAAMIIIVNGFHPFAIMIIVADTNVIGLLNHREFVIMVRLPLIGVLGIMVDIWLAILIMNFKHKIEFG